MGVQAVFVVLLMFAATVKAQGDVEFWRKRVTLTCPGVGAWHENEKNVNDGETYEFELKDKAQYSCVYNDNMDNKIFYTFYVKGKTCENCFELDGLLFLLFISADLIGSVLLMMIIYRCNKKKGSDGPAHPAKAPVKPGGRGPPVPSPDYESLNLATRTADTYSTVVNRMG